MTHTENIVRSLELAGIPKEAAKKAIAQLTKYLTAKELIAIQERLHSYKAV